MGKNETRENINRRRRKVADKRIDFLWKEIIMKYTKMLMSKLETRENKVQPSFLRQLSGKINTRRQKKHENR